MRTKTFCVFDLIDKIFWILIGLMPVILYAISLHHASVYHSFSSFLQSGLGVTLNPDSIIYSSLSELFVNGGGYFDLFTYGGIFLEIIVWLFSVEFAHVLFDALVFIPRWTGSILDKAVSR